MIVIGFAGPARVGKSFVTESLKDQAEAAGWNVTVLPFAKPLKDEASANGFGKEVDPEGYRKYCQEVGAAARADNADHWLDGWRQLLADVIAAEHADDSGTPYMVIADDVRYENELAAIRSRGGSVLFMHPGERELPEAGAAWRTHESEDLANHAIGSWDLPKNMFDGILYNQGTSVDMDKWTSFYFRDLINDPSDGRDICDCEACNAKLENREMDTDQIDKELGDILKDMEDRLNKRRKEEGDDNDE